MAAMADPTPSPTPQDSSSNPPPSQSPIPNPSPNSTSTNPNLPNSESQPISTQPPPTTATVTPNPTTAPPFPPPQINPFPSFRPQMHVPQFTPIPHNPNLQGFQSQQQQNHGVPPPGVTSAPPQQQPSIPGQPQQTMPGQPQPIIPGQQQQQTMPGQPQPMIPGQQQQQTMPGQQQPMIPGQQQQPMIPGQQQAIRPQYMAMPNGYMHPPPHGSLPPGVVRYPYPPMARPPFLARPGVVGMAPPLQRPPFLALRPPVTLPIVRPAVTPVILPVEKPQTTVYVGKIAPSVENDFIRSLLELCGPIKSWKRAQDPSDGTPRRFGFCEFESAEGVLRALRLLSKCSVDGEELVLNVNQATREYLERYVEKKKENLNKPSETGTEEAKKEGESAPGVEKSEGNEKEEHAKVAVEEPKKDANGTENKENDMASFGLVTDEDRDVDRESLEKLKNMIEERIKNKPLPPPPPPPHMNNSNLEGPAKSGDKNSDIDTVKNDDKIDDETTSETKLSNRAGTESPDRSRRYDNRSRDRDRDRREKERELDRLERERERERSRRERERDLEIQKAERFYKERVKEWETREKEREYERKREREKEKERERERRRLVAEQEDESDDDSRKRRRKSDIEDKRRRRRREKEEDLADRLKEEEEIVEAMKRAEEEQQKQQEKQALELPSVPVANGSERPVSLSPKVAASKIKDDMEHDHDSAPTPAPALDPAAPAPAPASHTGDVADENGITDEPAMALGPTSDVKLTGNAPAKKLGFGLVGSGKRTAVPSVFHEEEDDDAQKEKKMRPLVPIDYSTEELQAINTNDGEAPPISAESGKRVNTREAKSDVEKDRSRRSHDRSSHRDRERDDEAPRPREILHAKQLIDMIPKTKEDLFSYEINWTVYDENRLHERMRPWISKKITEFLGEEETTLVEFIVDRFREHVKAERMLDVLQRILDEEAEMFVLKMWRMLIFEIKRVETGLTTRPGA